MAMGALSDAPSDARPAPSTEPAPAPDPAPAPPPVAAEGARDQLVCPLCEYSLRGLVEPRCPECGYAFDWGELTDPSRRLHPYLFEHHPESNWRAWRRSLVGGLRPGRFWRELHPAQASRPGRLALYAVLCAATLLITVIAGVGLTAYRIEAEFAQERARSATAWRKQPGVIRLPGGGFRLRTAAEIQQMIDASWPPLGSAAFFRHVRRDHEVRWAGLAALTLLAWPVLTLATLMIFHQSMAAARVRPIHVARCVVYSADVLVWAGLGLLVLLAADVAFNGAARAGFESASSTVARLLWLATFLIAAWRLAVAYRLYLRMDRPFLTILAAQIIVALALLLISVESERLRWIGW